MGNSEFLNTNNSHCNILLLYLVSEISSHQTSLAPDVYCVILCVVLIYVRYYYSGVLEIRVQRPATVI